MVNVFAAAVAAHVGDATFVVVGGCDTGVAVGTAVGLACRHERLEIGVGDLRGWRHAVVGVCWVGGISESGVGGVWLEVGLVDTGAGGGWRIWASSEGQRLFEVVLWMKVLWCRRRAVRLFAQVVHGGLGLKARGQSQRPAARGFEARR